MLPIRSLQHQWQLRLVERGRVPHPGVASCLGHPTGLLQQVCQSGTLVSWSEVTGSLKGKI